MANNRADGWGTIPPAELRPYFTFETYQAGKAYPYGSIMMWNSPPDSHIAIVLHCDGSNWIQVFEQNADPTGSVCGTKNREVNNIYHKANYVMVPIVQAPAPPTPPVPKYQVTETYPNGRQIQLTKQPTNLWGMNFDFDYMKDHPVEVHNAGEIWTVTNKVHHEDGYDYYRRDGQVDGFNVADCTDYTPPPPPPPPAAPVTVTKAETLTLVTDLLCYGKAVNAMQATTPTGELKAGTYFVWDRQLGAVNLSTSNMTDQGQWVNEKLNVAAIPVLPPKITETIKEAAALIPPAPPTPLPDDSWKGTIASFSINRDQPEYFNSLNNVDMAVHDLDGKGEPQILHAYSQHIPIVATIEKDRILYALPKKSYDLNRYYCIPMYLLEAEQGGLFDTFKTYEEKLYTHSAKLSDHFKEAGKQFIQFIDGIKQTIAGKDSKK